MSRPISDPVFDIGRDLQRAYDEGYKQGRHDEKQDAIDALCRRCDLAAEDDEPCTEKCNDIKILEKLPSAQPGTARRIVGKSRDGITLWYQCDMCNEPVDAQDNFCSGCGRRLTDG